MDIVVRWLVGWVIGYLYPCQTCQMSSTAATHESQIRSTICWIRASPKNEMAAIPVFHELLKDGVPVAG